MMEQISSAVGTHFSIVCISFFIPSSRVKNAINWEKCVAAGNFLRREENSAENVRENRSEIHLLLSAEEVQRQHKIAFSYETENEASSSLLLSCYK